jgi:hypothetical protein
MDIARSRREAVPIKSAALSARISEHSCLQAAQDGYYCLSKAEARHEKD